jgi:hypothetical protein
MKKLTYILPLVLTLSACGGGGGGGSGSGSSSANPGTGTGTGTTGTGAGAGASTGTTGAGTGTTGTTGTGTTGTGDGTGAGSGAPTQTGQASLGQYVGTYSTTCFSGSKKRVTITPVSADTMTLSIDNEYYANTACGGGLVGNVNYDAPVTIKYTGTRNGGYYYLPQDFKNGGVLEKDVPLDFFTATVPATHLVFTGSAVVPGVDSKTNTPVKCIKFTDSRSQICADDNAVRAALTDEYAITLKGGTILYLGGPEDSKQPEPYNTLHPVQVPYVKQ